MKKNISIVCRMKTFGKNSLARVILQPPRHQLNKQPRILMRHKNSICIIFNCWACRQRTMVKCRWNMVTACLVFRSENWIKCDVEANNLIKIRRIEWVLSGLVHFMALQLFTESSGLDYTNTVWKVIKIKVGIFCFCCEWMTWQWSVNTVQSYDAFWALLFWHCLEFFIDVEWKIKEKMLLASYRFSHFCHFRSTNSHEYILTVVEFKKSRFKLFFLVF